MAQAAGEMDFRTDFSLLIDGELRTASQHLDVINPAEGRVFAQAPAAGQEELNSAVHAARRAFNDWKMTSYAERAGYVNKLAAGLREHQDALAELLTREQGKPIGQSVAEIDRGAAQSEGMVGIEIPIEPAHRRRSAAYRAAVQASGRGRDHHPLECTGQSRSRATRVGALHRQHGRP